jgi:IS1 family transposase
MPTRLTTNWSRFPPRTREVQRDEKWAFVGKKQAQCDPADPDDAQCGDHWDHVAYDPEHRLVLAVVPGSRTIENTEAIVEEMARRLDPKKDLLITTDELAAYESAIPKTFDEPVEEPDRKGPGRPRILPKTTMPPRVVYATVHKRRENNRVVGVTRVLVAGTEASLNKRLKRSKVSRTINTSFVERLHGTDRGRNARKVRRTYRFSKDWEVHEAMTYFTLYSDNFCWCVRTLRKRDGEGQWQQRTPAMAAGLTEHAWTLLEWVTFPATRTS